MYNLEENTAKIFLKRKLCQETQYDEEYTNTGPAL